MPHYINSRYFTCDSCKETFLKNWSEEEAVAEYRQLFGEEPEIDAGSVCDECYEVYLEAEERSKFESGFD